MKDYYLAYSGGFVKCIPADRRLSADKCICELTVLTKDGEVYTRISRLGRWRKVTTPPQFLFLLTNGRILEVSRGCISNFEATSSKKLIYDVLNQVIYRLSNCTLTPIRVLKDEYPESQCQVEIIVPDQTQLVISTVGTNPEVAPESQIPASQVVFSNNQATINVSSLVSCDPSSLIYTACQGDHQVRVTVFIVRCGGGSCDFCQTILPLFSGCLDGICGTPGPNTVNVPTDYPTIQEAINAAALDSDIGTITVSDGVYPQALIIPSGVSNLTITAVNTGLAIIQPLPVFTGNDLITVEGQCITINGFTIQGPWNPITVPFNRQTGIYVTNGGSAIITNNIIQDIHDDPIVTGTQHGNAIDVNQGYALIENNQILRYQKTGVRINLNSCGVIRNNVITGVGPTNVIAQNGIQVGRSTAQTVSARALIEGNTISGNSYTISPTVSTGMLLFNLNGEGYTAVLNNEVFDNDIGIYLGGFADGASATNYLTGVLVQENNIHNNEWGIYADVGVLANIFSNNTVYQNTVFNFQDNTVGLYSANTSNSYLCNTCTMGNPDNHDGAICSSTSPLSAIGLGPVLVSPAIAVSVD